MGENFYALKRILFQNLSNSNEELYEIYKEYFMCSIASILRVGPKIHNLFGYDIIVTKNSAFFAMELCQNYTRSKYKDIKK